MPTAFDEITVGWKVLSLGLEIGRAVSNQVKSWRRNSDHRFLSSLTTLEIVEEAGKDQVAHYVQDRTVKIRRDGARIPPFKYGSDGKDEFGRVTVVSGRQVVEYNHRILETNGREKTVGLDVDRVFSKGTIIRCVLTASSINGFPADAETMIYTVHDWTDISTTFIIFPRNRPPHDLEVTFRSPDEHVWRQVTREKNELRHYPGGRKAFVLEAANPHIGQEYMIAWKWQ